MGGMAGLLDKLPGMGQVPDAVKAQVGDKEIKKLIAIVNSMTPQERTFPAIIKGCAQEAHRGRIRYPGAGREQAPEAVHPDAEDDEKDEGRRHGQDDARHERQDAGWFPRWWHAARRRFPVLIVRLPDARCGWLCLLGSLVPVGIAGAADPCETLIEQSNAQLETMRRHAESIQESLQGSERGPAAGRAAQRRTDARDRAPAGRAARAACARPG